MYHLEIFKGNEQGEIEKIYRFKDGDEDVILDSVTAAAIIGRQVTDILKEETSCAKWDYRTIYREVVGLQ